MKFKSARFLPLAIALAVISILDASYFTVDLRVKAVVLQFGKILRVEDQPGFHLRIPYLQTVKKFDARLSAAESGPQSITTKDQKQVEISAYAKWRIKDVVAFYHATAGQQLRAVDLLSKMLDRVLVSELSAHPLKDVVSGNAETLAGLSAAATDQTRDLGIEIVDVRIKSIELPKDNDFVNTVYDRMRAERQRVAADLRAQGSEDAQKIRADADGTAQTVLAEAYRRAEQLRGEGDAKATEIYARAYGQDPEFFAFYRSLNAYRASFKDKQDVLVLEPKGEFFKYFREGGGK